MKLDPFQSKRAKELFFSVKTDSFGHLASLGVQIFEVVKLLADTRCRTLVYEKSNAKSSRLATHARLRSTSRLNVEGKIE